MVNRGTDLDRLKPIFGEASFFILMMRYQSQTEHPEHHRWSIDDLYLFFNIDGGSPIKL